MKDTKLLCFYLYWSNGLTAPSSSIYKKIPTSSKSTSFLDWNIQSIVKVIIKFEVQAATARNMAMSCL